MSDKPARIGRGLWRGVYSSIVDHPDFQVLSAHARLTLFVCRLGSQAGPASIFRYYREPLMVQTGLTAAELEAALSELEQRPSPSKPWIIRDDAIVWVRNGLKHDPTLSLQHYGHRGAVIRALSALPYTPTVKKFFRYYGFTRGRGRAISPGWVGVSRGGSGDHNSDTDSDTDSDTTPIPTPTPRLKPPPSEVTVVTGSNNAPGHDPATTALSDHSKNLVLYDCVICSQAHPEQTCTNEAEQIRLYGRTLTLLERNGRQRLPARLSEARP
jgi:hypothetical protein